MKTCVVIYNPTSGHTIKKSNIPRYKALIEKFDYEVEFIATEYKGHAKKLVQRMEHKDLVMSMGGDGTFNEIVYGNSLRKEPLLLAHVPIGTTNDIGRMFGYSDNTEKNIQACLKGDIKTIDIPTVNNRPFVYVGGFGKFLNIAYDTTREDKKKYGYLAYVISAIKDYFTESKTYEITYSVDGKVYRTEASMMMICNATRIAGMESFFKNVKLDDDLFEVFIVTAKKRLDIIRALGLSVFREPADVKNVIAFRTNNIKIKFKEKLKKNWCIDGERLEVNPLTFEIKNTQTIRLLIPKKNVNKLFTK